MTARITAGAGPAAAQSYTSSATGDKRGRRLLVDLLSSRTFTRRPWHDDEGPKARSVVVGRGRILVHEYAATRWRGAFVLVHQHGTTHVVDSEGRELLLTDDENRTLSEAWGAL